MWKLTIEDDEGKRTPVSLVRDEYSVGRGDENAVRLTERNISRRHARFRRAGATWTIEDLASYNGTWVNGERVVGEQALAHGDVVQLGDYRLDMADAVAAETERAAADARTASEDRFVVVGGPLAPVDVLIAGPVTTFGSAEGASVVLAHGSVSPVHAEVHALGVGRYEIVDRSGGAGVRVNGSSLERGLIEAGDVIELGEVRLKLVAAGQTYRTGPSMVPPPVRTMPSPPIASGVAAAQSAEVPASVDSAPAPRSLVPAPGGFGRAAIGGALVAFALLGVALALRSPGGPAPAERVPVATGAPSAAPSASAPATAAGDAVIAEARALAAGGQLEAAHAKLASLLADDPERRDDADVARIEQAWADQALSQAAAASDASAKRALYAAVAQAIGVPVATRKRAADVVAAMGTPPPSTLGGGIVRVPPWGAGTAAPPSPAAPTASGAAATEKAARAGAGGSAADFAAQGLDGEAKLRASLEPRVWSGKASVSDIKMLRAICRHMGDKACADRASQMLAKAMQ